MKVLADQYIFRIKEFIADQFEVSLFDPSLGLPADATEYESLLVRTVIPLNQSTLPETGKIKFIGTASAGFDHLDLDYLTRSGIHCANSAGCNANAVAEYIITVLFKWAREKYTNPAEKTIGLIGCGNTGTAVSRLLNRLSFQVVQYDPPRAQRDPSFRSASLDELLQCDILSFHTPLTAGGAFPTYHMCKSDWLETGFDLIINASRGGVVSENDLLVYQSDGLVQDVILDVWEDEPCFSDETAQAAFLATPHIAGYSKEAKANASRMIADHLCNFWEIECHPVYQQNSPQKPAIEAVQGLSFADFLWKHHNIDYFNRELRKLIGLKKEEKSYRFLKLRSATELRTEFGTLKKYFPPDKVPDEFNIFG